jgi:Lon protease-like protein
MSFPKHSPVPAQGGILSGPVPLFPLAHPTLYPGLTQPFQIFEPRYRRMAEHALEGDRLIAMTVLKPHWERKYDLKTVPIQPVVCVGKIVVDEKLPDGRYLLMLRGLCRARIVEEQEGEEPFRLATLQEVPDVMFTASRIDRDARRVGLMSLFRRMFPGLASQPGLAPFLQDDVSLGTLCDLLAFSLQLSNAESYSVLAESNIDLRSDLVLDFLNDRIRAHRASASEVTYSAAFSAN